MSETIEKLRPDRDLQCYFFRPSAIAAFSNSSSSGFTVSGTWRQQFDWAVVEWNKHNVFEHPLLRNLPGWGPQWTHPQLSGAANKLYSDGLVVVPDGRLAVPPHLGRRRRQSGAVVPCAALRQCDRDPGELRFRTSHLSLQGTLTAGDVVELAWQDEHYFHTILSSDTIASVLQTLSDTINALSSSVSSQHSGAAGTITLTNLKSGEEGNNLGVIANVSGAQSESWSPASQTMSGGQSPTEWQVDLNFSNLQDIGGSPIPAQSVRKMRWTYSAGIQQGAYFRSEFEVLVSNWTVTGTNRAYKIAAPRSRRFEDNGNALYSGTWVQSPGEFLRRHDPENKPSRRRC